MANRKISDLTALTAPATGDLLPIVDISEAAAADKNKKITYGELLASAPAGSAAAPSFSFDGDPNTGIFNPAADTLAFAEGGVEAIRIDSSGRLLVGTSTDRGGVATGASHTAIFEKSNENYAQVILATNQNNTNGAYLTFIKSRGTTANSRTIVSSGDEIGAVAFEGSDGTNSLVAAKIQAVVDGTPGANDMPGRLAFSTTADGAASPTERMSIKSNGIINFSNAPTYADNTAATAGGLAVGDVYKTVLGVLMIRF